MAAKAKQTSRRQKMEVLVGHCLRETQVVGIQEAESYRMAQRLRYGGLGEILIYKIDVWQIFDFDIDGHKVISIPLMTRRHQLRIHSL